MNTCPEAKKYIKALKSQLTEKGLIDNVDSLVLLMIEVTYHKWFEATQFLLENGTTVEVTTREGDRISKDYPQVKSQLDAQIQLFKYLSDFGGTASSRKRVKDIAIVKEDFNPLTEFFKTN